MARTTYKVDTSHSAIRFTVRHMMFAKVHGRFDKWAAELELDEDDPTNARVDVKIEAASVSTSEDKRDGHLRSADFFDVEHHPELRFVSKRVEKKGDDLHLVGDLTIRGTTREVALEVERLGEGKNPWGQRVIGFSAHGKIERKDFGLTWNAALETGGVLVGDAVNIEIELEATGQEAATVAA
jgi:polyisoprenoid-binding protein YceI